MSADNLAWLQQWYLSGLDSTPSMQNASHHTAERNSRPVSACDLLPCIFFRGPRRDSLLSNLRAPRWRRFCRANFAVVSFQGAVVKSGIGEQNLTHTYRIPQII